MVRAGSLGTTYKDRDNGDRGQARSLANSASCYLCMQVWTSKLSRHTTPQSAHSSGSSHNFGAQLKQIPTAVLSLGLRLDDNHNNHRRSSSDTDTTATLGDTAVNRDSRQGQSVGTQKRQPDFARPHQDTTRETNDDFYLGARTVCARVRARQAQRDGGDRE